jgi:hypothetical protein
VLAFRADENTRATVEDLMRREAACCPFVDYRLETVGEEIVWTLTTPATGEDRAGVELVLDAFSALATRQPGRHAAAGWRAIQATSTYWTSTALLP